MNIRLNKPTLSILWFNLLILSYLLFSYYVFGGWWNSSAGTILIIFFGYLTWKKDFIKITGLNLNLKKILVSLATAFMITVCAFLIMNYIAEKHMIRIYYSSWKNYYHDVFYILNEEMVLGAILLFKLINNLKMRPVIASVGLAVVFSLIHYVFYRWIFLDRGIMQVSTLVTLFLIGFIRNNLILMSGHIGYSWALHFGWMAVMFGSFHFNTEKQLAVSEIEKFNTYLGSYEMLIISIILAVISLIYWIKRYKSFPDRIYNRSN